MKRSEEHTSELQSRSDLVCRLLLEKKKNKNSNLNHCFISNYSLSISPEHLSKLAATSINELRVMVIVTMTRELKDVTINLQGPLIINPGKRLGLQLVIVEGTYSTRHPLFGDKLQIAAEEVISNASAELRVAVG